MKHLFTTPGCVILTLVFFALGSVLSPTPAVARWHDNSPKGADLTPVLVVGGAVVVACVVYLIVKHKDKDGAHKLEVIAPTATNADDTQKSDSTMVPVEQQGAEPESSIQETTKSASKLVLFLDARPAPQPQTLPNERQRFDLSSVAVRAGISFSF